MEPKTLNSQLEIIIPTYNRKAHLEYTLQLLTAPESPVKNCKITVLDNASTDGTAQVIEQFAAKFSNLTHVRRPKNIGGNANIARAFEMARAPYVWIVCDDDSFKWDAWGEIENALMSGEYDILLTRKNDLHGTSELAKIVRQLTFLPAGIYKTSNITSGVLMNMYANIANLFPHLAVVCEVVNKKGIFFLPQGDIIDNTTFDVTKSGDGHYTRGAKDAYVPETAIHMFWTPGFVFSLHMIEDKKIRAYILDHVGRHGFFGYIWGAFRKNYTFYGGYRFNEQIVASALGLRQRIEFYIACLGLRMLYFFSKRRK